jgi:hypothetical protein
MTGLMAPDGSDRAVPAYGRAVCELWMGDDVGNGSVEEFEGLAIRAGAHIGKGDRVVIFDGSAYSAREMGL